MKKRKLIIALLPVLLLSSCNRTDTSKVLSDAKEAVSAITAYTETSYTVAVTGNISKFTSFAEMAVSSVPNPGLGNSSKNRSFILRNPLIITTDNFYPADDLPEGSDTSTYSYNRIITRLESPEDAIHNLEFRKDGDDLVFYICGVSKNLKFYNVYCDDKNPDIASDVIVNSRFDITLTYSKTGLLKTEKIVSPKSPNGNADSYVDLLSTFTYTE